jgi:sigma-E factor negative regulatory protein RseC
MTETGKVREVRENLVVVLPDRSVACFGCMNAECRSGAGFITAENPAGLPLREGQTVEVNTVNASLLSQALIALLPPILGFLLGFNLTGLLFPFPTAPDGASVGMGLLFLFAAAFVVYLVRKKRPAGRGYKVTRRIA